MVSRTSLSFLALELTSFTTLDGQVVPLETQIIEQEGPSTIKKDAKRIGILAGIGAAVGGAFGGGKGALKGAAAGAGAGARRGESSPAPPVHPGWRW